MMKLEDLKEGYLLMVKQRLFEEKIKEIYTSGLMPGFSHLYIGQEAVAAGVSLNLNKDDYVTSTHRGHGHLIAKGAEFDKMIAEVMGKKGGYCKGKGGSMHIMNLELGILGANGIVGGSIPAAVGAGYSIKYRGTDQVVACYFGDAATNQGTFHESLNMASVFNLPVLFICENNKYGISVCQERHQKCKDISSRSVAYDMPGYVVDGNDLEEVFSCVKDAVKYARAGKGPVLIECLTYRWGGHHVGDPGTAYRDKAEVEAWKKRCPIKALEKKMLKKGVNKSYFTEINDRIQKEIDEATEWAKNSPFPEPEEAMEDLFI
jgi:acetoin:2,6-dichlorophenolindophenol oxidoreductase subunit alpha